MQPDKRTTKPWIHNQNPSMAASSLCFLTDPLSSAPPLRRFSTTHLPSVSFKTNLSSSASLSASHLVLRNTPSIIPSPSRNPTTFTVFAHKGYKMKTHKASAKRFRVTGTGKIVRRRAGKQHLLGKKNTKRKLRLSKMQFHEWLSSKARPKQRSTSWSSQEEVVGQQIQAKLYAAEQKSEVALMDLHSALTQIIISNPALLDLHSAVPRIKFWSDLFGGKEADIVMAFKYNKGLAGQSIPPKISLLHNHHELSTHEIGRMMRSLARLLRQRRRIRSFERSSSSSDRRSPT